MKVIELAGLPCAGKTTFAQYLDPLLPGEGWESHIKSLPRTRSMLMAISIILHLPLIAAAVLFSHHNRLEAFRLSAYHCRLLAFLVAKHREGCQNLLIDQGVVQSFASTFLHAGNISKLRKLMVEVYFYIYETVGVEISVCFMEIAMEQSVERIKLRKSFTSRFERMAPADLHKFLVRFKALLDEIVDNKRTFKYTLKNTTDDLLTWMIEN